MCNLETGQSFNRKLFDLVQGGLQLVHDIISIEGLFKANNFIPPNFAVTTQMSSSFDRQVGNTAKSSLHSSW